MNLRKRLAAEEGATGCFLFGGAALMLAGFFLTWLFSVAGVFRGTYTRTPVTNEITDPGTLNWAPLTLGIAFFGLFVSLGALAYGIYRSRRPAHGERFLDPNARVVARYGYSPDHVLLTEEWQFDAEPRARFYVKIDHGVRGIVEYECRREVYEAAGEGMWGTADVQGRWLGGFSTQAGRAPELRAVDSAPPNELRDSGLR